MCAQQLGRFPRMLMTALVSNIIYSFIDWIHVFALFVSLYQQQSRTARFYFLILLFLSISDRRAGAKIQHGCASISYLSTDGPLEAERKTTGLIKRAVYTLSIYRYLYRIYGCLYLLPPVMQFDRSRSCQSPIASRQQPSLSFGSEIKNDDVWISHS